MPTSTKYIIAPLIKLAEQIRPSSILDIGIGFGKWGFLLREYLEVWRWDNSLYEDKDKFKWLLTIDGIEICEKYIKDLQKNIYNTIYKGDVFNLIDEVGNYDLIIMGDVIEHFEKEKGRALLNKCLNKANKAVLVNTPIAFFSQGNLHDNPAEIHKSLWTKDDFMNYGDVQVSYIKGILIIVLSKMDKKFKFENRYKAIGNLNRIVAFLQSRNIERNGIENANEGFFMKLYSLSQGYREKKLRIINS